MTHAPNFEPDSTAAQFFSAPILPVLCGVDVRGYTRCQSGNLPSISFEIMRPCGYSITAWPAWNTIRDILPVRPYAIASLGMVAASGAPVYWMPCASAAAFAERIQHVDCETPGAVFWVCYVNHSMPLALRVSDYDTSNLFKLGLIFKLGRCFHDVSPG